MPEPISPLFTVIVPVYNRAQTIGATLESLLQQSFDNFEVIIVDDGSTDETYQVVEKYLNYSNFSYYFKHNEERAVARNYGIDRANGEFITFLDSDDGYYPYCLCEAQNFLKQNQQVRLFHLSYEVVRPDGTCLEKKICRELTLNNALLTGNHVSCINVFVKKEVLQNDKFDTAPALIGSEDYELWLRLSAKIPFYCSPKVCAYLVQHPGRSVLDVNPHKLKRRMDYLIKKISNNSSILEAFSSSGIRKIQAHTYLYWSLHLAMGGFTSKSIVFMFKALKVRLDIEGFRKIVGILKVSVLQTPPNKWFGNKKLQR